MGGDPVLAITGWRAQTLKVAAYDGDIVRIAIPRDATVTWAQHMADPAGDLHSPMKGPFKTQRDGSAAPHRAAITLAKAARLLPAIIAVAVEDPKGFATKNGDYEETMTSDGAVCPVVGRLLKRQADHMLKSKEHT